MPTIIWMMTSPNGDHSIAGHQSQQGAEEVKVGKQFETHPEAAAVPGLADDTCQSQQVHQQKIELVASG